MRLQSTLAQVPAKKLAAAKKYRERMLQYNNPVEFVNNMYGCHPSEDGSDYFTKIYC